MGLEAENIYFRYGKKQPWIFEGRSLAVEKGERVAVSAPSGYGKTTLAMLLAGYLKPERGQILIDGVPLPQKGVCPVQLICQHPEKAVNPRWKMKWILEESGGIREDILEAFGIEHAWLKRYPEELSGGELQRFCVARALQCAPDYLICDEISTMLDVITQAQIWNVLVKEAQKRNMGIIVITHDKYLAEAVAERKIDIRSGSDLGNNARAGKNQRQKD